MDQKQRDQLVQVLPAVLVLGLLVPVSPQLLQEDTGGLAVPSTEQQEPTPCNSCAAGSDPLHSLLKTPGWELLGHTQQG